MRNRPASIWFTYSIQQLSTPSWEHTLWLCLDWCDDGKRSQADGSSPLHEKQLPSIQALSCILHMSSINRNWAFKQMTATGTTSVEISILALQAQSVKQPWCRSYWLFLYVPCTCRLLVTCYWLLNEPSLSPLRQMLPDVEWWQGRYFLLFIYLFLYCTEVCQPTNNYMRV